MTEADWKLFEEESARQLRAKYSDSPQPAFWSDIANEMAALYTMNAQLEWRISELEVAMEKLKRP